MVLSQPNLTTNISLGLASEESLARCFVGPECKVVYLRGRNQGSWGGSRLGRCQGWTSAGAPGAARRGSQGVRTGRQHLPGTFFLSESSKVLATLSAPG